MSSLGRTGWSLRTVANAPSSHFLVHEESVAMKCRVATLIATNPSMRRYSQSSHVSGVVLTSVQYLDEHTFHRSRK